MQDKLLPVMDMAYSALLQDTHDRGLTDSTLIICMGEFGRTPKINAEAGRDHWPATQVFALGGGGIKTGVVVGATNERSEYPTERPLSVQDFSATVYGALGISPDLAYPSNENRPPRFSPGASRSLSWSYEVLAVVLGLGSSGLRSGVRLRQADQAVIDEHCSGCHTHAAIDKKAVGGGLALDSYDAMLRASPAAPSWFPAMRPEAS
jgi:hypothetical protein